MPYATGFAYGLVLQAVEMSVGVGLGLLFLAREGISFAGLRRMQQDEDGRPSTEPGAAEPPSEGHAARRSSSPTSDA